MTKSLEMLIVEIDSELKLSGPVPAKAVKELKRRLIIDNPKYIENERRGRSNWNVPRKLQFICLSVPCKDRHDPRKTHGDVAEFYDGNGEFMGLAV